MKIKKSVPKAKTQYNELLGTIAADFSDLRIGLKDFAQKKESIQISIYLYLLK